MAYQFVIIDEDNWAPSWREQYRRIEKQVNDDLVTHKDPAISQDNLSKLAGQSNDILIDQIKDEYRRTGKRDGVVENKEVGIELSYQVDALDSDDLWVDLYVQSITAKKQEYARLINYRFLYRNGMEHDLGMEHVSSLELLDFNDFRNKVKCIKSQSLTRLYNYYKYMELLGYQPYDNNITYTIIYDTLRRKLILGNIDVQEVKLRPCEKTLEILIPGFIDEVQHISTLLKYEKFYGTNIEIKLESVQPLVMTNLYQYQMMDLYNTEQPGYALKNKTFEGYISNNIDVTDSLYNLDQIDWKGISLDLTNLQLKAISISDIENQINKQKAAASKQLAMTRILKQLEKSNKYIQSTTKTLQIKATDLYDLVELNGKEYKSREDWVKTYYDEIQDYIDITKNSYLGLPCILPCNFTADTVKISNKTVYNATNLRGLFSYIGAKTVTISNDLDNFNKLDGSDEVCDLFGDKNIDGMLEDSRINEVKTENMSDYETEMISREHKRSRAELRDKVETYKRK